MKKFILFIVLICTSMLLFSVAPTFAVKPITRVVPTNSHCDTAAPGTCVIINGYTIKAYIIDNGYLAEVVEDDLNNGKWPVKSDTANITEYTYWAGRTIDNSTPPTPSYIILDLEGIPLDADPPGAQLPLSKFECGDYEIDSSRIAFKINPNPTLSATKDITFKITEAGSYSYDICSGNAFIRFNDGCYLPTNGRLMMPDSDGQSAWVQKRRFECSTSIAMLVEYEQCTAIPKKVEYEKDGVAEFEVGYFSQPWLFMDVPDYADPNTGLTYRLDPLNNMGPEQGTVLCTDDSLPVFLWRDRGYFSKYPNPPQ